MYVSQMAPEIDLEEAQPDDDDLGLTKHKRLLTKKLRQIQHE
jgi:hypothetical protein